jgi:hypothetical protein
MNKFLILFCLIVTPCVVQAQILKPVKWSYAAKKTSSNEAVIFFKAVMDKGWHIYSQNVKDGGPTKTVFTFNHSSQYITVGKTIEPKPISHFDKVFGMQVGYFEQEVIFQQKIKLKAAGSVLVKCTIEYGVCNDHQCLPPEDLVVGVVVK